MAVASQWLLDRGADGRPARVIEANTYITAQMRATIRLRVLADASHTFAAAGLDALAILGQVAAFIGN